MANKNTLQLYAQLSVEVQNAAKAAKDLETYFGKLKLGDKVGTQITGGIEKAVKAAEKYEQVLAKAGSGALDKNTLNNITKYGDEAARAFSNLEKVLNNVESASIKGIFSGLTNSSKDIQSLNQKLNELAEKAKNAANSFSEDLTKGLNNVKDATLNDENLFNTTKFKSIKADLKDLFSSLDSGANVEIIKDDQTKTIENLSLKLRELEENKNKLEKQKEAKILDLKNTKDQLDATKKKLKEIEKLQEELKNDKNILSAKKADNKNFQSDIKQLKEMQTLYKSLADQQGFDFSADFKKVSAKLGVANNSNNKQQTRINAEVEAAKILLGIQEKITEELAKQRGTENQSKTSLENKLKKEPEKQEKIDNIQKAIDVENERIKVLTRLQEVVSSLNFTQLENLNEESSKAKEELQGLRNQALEGATEQFKKASQGAEETGNKINGVREAANNATIGLSAMQQEVSQLISRFTYFTSIAGIMQIVTKAVRSAYQSVKELDEAMNNIAVVTEMTTQDLWNQIDVYTQLANATGSTIKGVYEVAQLYYQQGLSTNEVMTMTTETLKMARIAGIDYAAATDYMTATIKGFGLAYEEVSHISDVYSNLAAKTATDTEEIAIAMSKVASIAHSTGMEMETTAAMLAQILEVTREAPETAGTALKTVIARFGEVKTLIEKGETTGTDEEGEIIDVNKIDAALKTAGMSLLDQTGQMRDLDDVLLELSSRWSSLSDMQQRYIATQAAGSRQQSRFLALMNDYEGLMKMVGYANDSAGASQEQFDKTLESLASKLNNLHNAWTEFTTGIANSEAIKWAVDALTKLLNVVNDLTGSFGDVGTAISRIALIGGGLKIGGNVLGGILSQNKALAGMSGVQALGGFDDIGSILKKIWNTGNTLKPGYTQLASGGFINSAGDTVSQTEAFASIAKGIKPAIEAVKAFKAGTSQATSAFKAFSGALGFAGWATIAVAAITLVVGAIDLFTISAKEAEQSYEEFSNKVSEGSTNIKKQSQELANFKEQLKETTELDGEGNKITIGGIEELAQGVNYLGENLTLTEEEMAKFESLAQQMVNLGLADSYEEATKMLSGYNGTLEENIRLLDQQLQREARANYVRLSDKEQKEANRHIQNIEKQQYREKTNVTLGDYYDTEGTEQTAEVRTLLSNALLQNSVGATWDKGEFEIDSMTLVSKYDDIIKYIKDSSYSEDVQNYIIENLSNAYESALGVKQSYEEQLYDLKVPNAENLETYLFGHNKDYQKMDVDTQDFVGDLLKINPSVITDEYDAQQGESAANQIVKLFAEEIETSEGKETIQEAYSRILALDPNDFDWDEYQLKITEFYKKLFELLQQGGYLTEGITLDSFMGSQNYNFNSVNQGIQNTVLGTEGQTAFSTLSNDPMDTSSGQEISMFTNEGAKLVQMVETANSSFAKWFATLGSDRFMELTKETKTAEEAWEKLNEEFKRTNFGGSTKDLEELAEAAREIHDSFDNLDISEIAKDGELDNAERYTEEYYNLKQAFDELRESQDGNFEAAEQLNDNIDLTSEKLAQEMIAAQGNADAFLALQFSKLGLNVDIFSSAGVLNADAYAAWSAKEAWDAAALAKARYGAGSAEAIAAATYASMVTATKGGGGSKGGGGGGGSKKAEPQQDRFYNYIKNLESVEREMEKLQDEMELLFDPEAIGENLDAQSDKFAELIGSNQSYLNALDADMAKMQASMTSKFGKYITFAEDGTIRLTEAYYDASGDIVEEMDAWIEEYDDLIGRTDDLEGAIRDLKKEAADFFNDMRDSAIDLTNELADILKERDEKALEEKEKYYEELEKKDDKYLEAIRENIEAERKARDRANTYEDLGKKQSKLALLQRDTSGLYANEISSLQEEIDQTQQDLADEQIDSILDAIEKENANAAERHDEILKAMQEQIDSNVETRYYIQQAEEAIKAGDTAVMDILMSGREWLESSDAERKKMEEEWDRTFSEASWYFTSGYKDSADYIASVLHDDLYTQTSRIVEAIGDIKFPSTSTGGGGGGGGGEVANPSLGGTHYYVIYRNGNKYSQKSGYNTVEAAGAAGKTELNNLKAKFPNFTWTYRYYKTGGLVDYTGPAWVDGTKSRPEAFLNPEQTQIIRQLAENLVRPNSPFSSGVTNSTTNNANCEINIEIGSIGNNVNIDEAIAKIKNEIIQSTQYRNVTVLTRKR